MTQRKARRQSWTDSSPPANGQARPKDSDTMLPAAAHATTPAPPSFPVDHGSEGDRETAGAELADDAFDPPTLNERRSSPVGSGEADGTSAEGGVVNSDEGGVVNSDQGSVVKHGNVPSDHLRGLLEALVFASDKPLTSAELARLASAPLKQTRDLLSELKGVYASRGIVLEEVAGGWLFRTSAQYAPFVRDLTSERPVRLSRAQVETLAIVAYRQPITRPEIDDIRGVDSGATLKLLLERDLVRILGKKDEPGRPILYGSTTAFLELFGLKSLKDLPTLKEFTELNEDSRRFADAALDGTFSRLTTPPSADVPSASPGRNDGRTSSRLPSASPEHDTTLLPVEPAADDSDDPG